MHNSQDFVETLAKVPRVKGDKKTVILGAGPAGLTAAYELGVRNSVPVLLLEKDPVYVGGISRTVEHHGYRFDIGGHRFFSKNDEIEALWTEVLGNEMLLRPRLSRIFYRGKYFDYPLKAANALFGLGPIETARCLASYMMARIHPVKDPKTFQDWVSNQFGTRLFSIFFKTYTEKVWGMPSNELSADWAAQRIKGLNLTEAIKNALFPAPKQKKNGEIIKTLIDEFRYPRLGPGQMWERVRDMLLQRGHRIAMGREVIKILHNETSVTGVVVRDSSGAQQVVSSANYISTLPIRELIQKCDPPLPANVIAAAEDLQYRDFLTVAVIIDKKDVFPDNWIYLHDPDVIAGRIQNFKNWSPFMTPDPTKTCLGLEYFCFENDGLWSSPDNKLIDLAGKELVKLKMCRPEQLLGGFVVRQQKAYPVYDDVYKQRLAVIRTYVEQHLTNLQLVGRNGMHHYNNQDHSMMTALLAARNILANSKVFDPWNVNTDAEYHETVSANDDDKSGRLVPQRVH